MANTLPGAGALIKDSWNAFTKNWQTTVRVSVWLIPSAIVTGLAAFFPGAPSGVLTALQTLGPLAGIVIAIWASICLYLTTITLERGGKVDEKTTANAWVIFPSLLLIGLLQGLATFGATLLLIIPGIYVGIRLGFSQMSLLTKGLKGRAALAASWALTKGRFWAIFGRQLGAGILFTILVGVLMMIAVMIVSAIAGDSYRALMADTDSPLANAVLNVISSIIQAILIPLIVVFQVKLYQALEKSA